MEGVEPVAASPTAAAASTSSLEKGKGREVARSGITKRKLESALEALDDVFRTTSAPPSKRRTARHRETPAFSTSKLMQLLKPPKPVEAAPKASPSSDPHSLPALLSRLATLRAAVYPDTKPRGLDAATTARHGWQSANKRDELKCATCGASWKMEALGGGRGWSEELTKERTAQLTSEHKPACPWRVRQCPTNLYRLPLNSLPLLLSDLSTRCETYESRSDALSTFQLTPLPDIIDLATLRATLDRRRTAGPFATLSDLSLQLALTGWSFSGTSTLPTLTCARCNRTPSIAVFTTRSFDAVAEHRPFCAFVDDAAWKRQLPRRLARSDSHSEGADAGFAWAWQGEGLKRKLSTRSVSDYVRGVLDARLPVRTVSR